jgi:chaperonin cofactor prefoldin
MRDIYLFLAGQAFIFISAIIGVYVRVMVKLKELELRVKMVENQDSQISKKLDEISRQITDLRVDMQNKQDRD